MSATKTPIPVETSQSSHEDVDAEAALVDDTTEDNLVVVTAEEMSPPLHRSYSIEPEDIRCLDILKYVVVFFVFALCGYVLSSRGRTDMKIVYPILLGLVGVMVHWTQCQGNIGEFWGYVLAIVIIFMAFTYLIAGGLESGMITTPSPNST